METDKKKILLISLCIMGMMVFIYLEFIPKAGDMANGDHLVNPAQLDNSISKRAVYAKQRKRERQKFHFDRKVSSLENFFENQVDKNPFPATDGDTGKIQVQPSISNLSASDIKKQLPPSTNVVNETTKQKSPISSLKENEKSNETIIQRKVGFASGGSDLESNVSKGVVGVNALAVVHERTNVKHGSNVKLRILESFSIEGVSVPKNTFVIGEVRFSDDHIYIEVRYISVNNQLLFANLNAYDLSGSKGIYVGGGGGTKIKTDALVNTVSEIQKNVSVPILRNVPFTTAKKKIREDEIPLVEGYKVYLRSQ